MVTLPPDFGARLRAARAYRSSRYSQADLAADLGRHANTIKAWENGAAVDELEAPEIVKRTAATTGFPEWLLMTPRLSVVMRPAADQETAISGRLDDLEDGINLIVRILTEPPGEQGDQREEGKRP